METYHLIDRYLNQEMRGEELLSFERKLKEDSSFAEEVEYQKIVNEVVRGSHFDSLRTKMQQDISKLEETPSSTKWWIGGLLALALLGGLSYLYYTPEAKNKISSVVSKETQKEAPEVLVAEEKESLPVKEKKKDKPSSRVVPQEAPPLEEKTSVETPIKSEELPVESPALEDAKENMSINPFYNSPSENSLRINCDEVKITAAPVIQGSCKGELNGSIIIYPDKIKGGIGPYKVAVDENSILQSKEIFSGLEAGPHLIVIKDKSGCISTQEIIVPEKDCPKMNIFAIQPDIGESWKIPASDSESGTLSIISGSGSLVYKSPFGNQGIYEWNGTDKSGSILPSGTYIYILEYSTGKRENGQININR